MNSLDALDRLLLERLQGAFPLVARPYAELGEILGLGESEVLARVGRLKVEGIIRQIGAIFDTRKLGYQSTLVAFHASDDALDGVAARVSAHPGVSHNYARPHHYNLWFTLAVPPGDEVEEEICRLAERSGVDDWLNLPALRVFKIRTLFRLVEDQDRQETDDLGRAGPEQRPFSPSDIPYVRALQRDLPLVSRPFAEASGGLGLTEDDLLDRARELESARIMRRFGAVLRHRRVGYMANGMACWMVPESRVETVGERAARYPQVSHCYQRPAYPPGWPYNLFTMIHGHSSGEVERIVGRLAGECGLDQYEILYSIREFKKERVRYFEV
jgi:DNA-binding Lrp family transcriptional regulator